MKGVRALITLILVTGSAACATDPGEPVEFTVPAGASFAQVADTLSDRGLITSPTLFRGYARLRGMDRSVRSGRYRVEGGIGWHALMDELVAGRVVTVALTVPEGFTLRQMIPRMAVTAETTEEEVERLLSDASAAERWEVPGPGLEGYLFPDTYHVAPGTAPESVIQIMVARYRAIWTPEREQKASQLGMSEAEVMTLASIIQAEARRDSEMPVISAVFHNRLRLGYPLQADPTVQYALAERRSRLLYSDIDEVADHPYNTYTNPGLPPGPIGAAGEEAVDAALQPARVDYLYFVARPDGTHIFTRTLEEHNRARREARRQWEEAERERARRSQEESERGSGRP